MSDQNQTITVSFMEPVPTGCTLIGSWAMPASPRRGEIVILQRSPRRARGKYRVKEVLHYLPAHGEPIALPAVTVLVVQIVESGDIDRAVTELSQQADPTTWPVPRVHHA